MEKFCEEFEKKLSKEGACVTPDGFERKKLPVCMGEHCNACPDIAMASLYAVYCGVKAKIATEDEVEAAQSFLSSVDEIDCTGLEKCSNAPPAAITNETGCRLERRGFSLMSCCVEDPVFVVDGMLMKAREIIDNGRLKNVCTVERDVIWFHPETKGTPLTGYNYLDIQIGKSFWVDYNGDFNQGSIFIRLCRSQNMEWIEYSDRTYHWVRLPVQGLTIRKGFRGKRIMTLFHVIWLDMNGTSYHRDGRHSIEAEIPIEKVESRIERAYVDASLKYKNNVTSAPALMMPSNHSAMMVNDANVFAYKMAANYFKKGMFTCERVGRRDTDRLAKKMKTCEQKPSPTEEPLEQEASRSEATKGETEQMV